MPYPVPSASLLEVSIRYEVAGQTCLNIVHFRLDADTDDLDGIAIINGFISLFDEASTGASFLLSEFTAQTTLIREIVCQWIYPNRRARRTFVPENALGSAEGTGAPPNVAGVATKRSDDAGRGGHGGIHIAGFSTDALATDRISGETVGMMQSYASWLTDNFSISTPECILTPVIYNSSTPAQSPTVTSCTMSTEPRTMRRRGLRLGI